jgi:alpha-D-xyloside xylohydrolase
MPSSKKPIDSFRVTMKFKNVFIGAVGLAVMVFASLSATGQGTVEKIEAGVDKISWGAPDKFTPYAVCEEKPMHAALLDMPAGSLPFKLGDIQIRENSRGLVIEIPLRDDEHIYGFGLQMNSFDQKGLRKKPVVNAYPVNNVGYSHAPMPYYISTKGYAILINTARYTTFYVGVHQRLDKTAAGIQKRKEEPKMDSPESLYAPREEAASSVTVDVPGAKGIEIFVFEGPDMKAAIQRYNLFSGGGALPAMWGLGVKYRVKSDFNDQGVYKMAQYFRDKHIPCDVFGLEPKWQSETYSSSFMWNAKSFPDPAKFVDSMKKFHMHINLWEHAYVSPKSPLYDPLLDKSGDYPVWGGLVPDFADAAARKVFADYHEKTFFDIGISGFKMDECDNAEYSRADINWGFPEIAQFPSGIDGEQMHQLFGILYGHTLYDIYKQHNQRSFFDIRSLNAFSSSFPAALYSDTYDQKEYIRLIGAAGFSGLLWSPEVRESSSENELIRRVQMAVLSAQCLFNSWYLKNPPWLQYDRAKNNADEFLPNATELEGHIRKLLDFRMSLIPYLYNAYAQYKLKGIPPFRSLITDYPDDPKVFNLYDEYMIGNDLLAAPLLGGTNSRNIYLPTGNWYDLNTHKKYAGGQSYTVSFDLDQLPVFVKENSILPLANPVEYVTDNTKFAVTCYVFGKEGTATLFADDGVTFNYEKSICNILTLNYKDGKGKVKTAGQYRKDPYDIIAWKEISGE